MTVIQELATLHKQMDRHSNKESISAPLLIQLNLLLRKYADSPENILHTYVKRLDNTIWNREQYIDTLKVIATEVDPENLIDSFKALNRKTTLRVRGFLSVVIHNFPEQEESEEFDKLASAEFSSYMAWALKK